MGRVYNVFSGVIFTTAAGDWVLRVLAVAEKPFKIKRIWMTSSDVAGASAPEVEVHRVTDAGPAGTACQKTPMLQADAATTVDADYDLGQASDPTSSAELWRGHWNCQVPFDLVFGPGDEPVIPGAANEGFAVKLETVVAPNMHVGATIEEMA